MADLLVALAETCPDCRGSGYDGFGHLCAACRGTGERMHLHSADDDGS